MGYPVALAQNKGGLAQWGRQIWVWAGRGRQALRIPRNLSFEACSQPGSGDSYRRSSQRELVLRCRSGCFANARLADA